MSSFEDIPRIVSLLEKAKKINSVEEMSKYLSTLPLSDIQSMIKRGFILNNIFKRTSNLYSSKMLELIVKTKEFSLCGVGSIIYLAIKTESFIFISDLLDYDTNGVVKKAIADYPSTFRKVWIECYEKGYFNFNYKYSIFMTKISENTILENYEFYEKDEIIPVDVNRVEILKIRFEDLLISSPLSDIKNSKKFMDILNSGHLCDYSKYIDMIKHQRYYELLEPVMKYYLSNSK